MGGSEGAMLSIKDIEDLTRFAESGNRIGYYETLEGAGVAYGALAGGVVRGDTISGRMANTFMAERAAQEGIQIDPREALSLSLDLMSADYFARKTAGWQEIGQAEIASYHESVFGQYGLTKQAWTATAPLDVIGRYYREYGFSSEDAARDAAWSILMREGFGPGVYIFDEMSKFGSPEGLGLSFDGYPLDPQAAEWVGFVSKVINDEGAYIFGGVGSPFPFDECFLAGTMISMWDGTRKPIEQIRAGDIVVSYDKDGNRKPGRVTRTMTGDAKQILDVHGMMVTPGHATLCGDGRFAGQHVPILDILRSDGALVREDGTKIRAGTGCPLGTMGDRMIAAISGILDPDGSVQITGAGQIRAGTRFIKADGEDLSVLDLILKTGGRLTDSGMIQSGTDGPEVPFLWTFTPSLPRPEDYVLQRSGTDLHDIYQANEWEAVRPAMPIPAGGEAGATISRHPALIAAAPVNVPLAMRARPDAPQLSRKYRRAAEAKARKKGNTVH